MWIEKWRCFKHTFIASTPCVLTFLACSLTMINGRPYYIRRSDDEEKGQEYDWSHLVCCIYSLLLCHGGKEVGGGCVFVVGWILKPIDGRVTKSHSTPFPRSVSPTSHYYKHIHLPLSHLNNNYHRLIMEKEVDAWIEQLAQCKQLSEDNVKKLCDKVLVSCSVRPLSSHTDVYALFRLSFSRPERSLWRSRMYNPYAVQSRSVVISMASSCVPSTLAAIWGCYSD